MTCAPQIHVTQSAVVGKGKRETPIFPKAEKKFAKEMGKYVETHHNRYLHPSVHHTELRPNIIYLTRNLL